MKTNKLLATMVAVLTSLSVYAQSVDEIIDKHVAAMGGMDKLKGIMTLVTERMLVVQGMEIPTKTTIVVGKNIRTESSVMGNQVIQVADGTSGWMVRPSMMGGTGEPEEMPAEMVKQQISQLDPFGPLVDYKQKGNTVELIGKENVAGKDAYRLKVTTKDGQVFEEFLDATTFLVNKIKMTMNGQPGEMDFSDYKDVEGLKFANKTEMANDQMGAITLTTNKITVNGTVDEAIFKKPVK